MNNLQTTLLGSLIIILLFCYFLFYKGLKNKTDVTNLPYWYSIGLIPFVEEVLFRYIPLLIYGADWTIGIPVSLFFGLLHSTSYQAKTFKIDLNDCHYIPATVAGFWLWHVNSEYGFWYAVLTHVLTNATTLLIVQFKGEINVS